VQLLSGLIRGSDVKGKYQVDFSVYMYVGIGVYFDGMVACAPY